MDESPNLEFAVARWLAHGVTSLTHPILRHVLETCFHPLGIEADWLESEPFGAPENACGCCWLRRPRWNPRRLDPRHPAAADLSAWAADAAAITVDAAGIIVIAAGPAAQMPEGMPDPTWLAIRHSVRAAQRAGSFIQAAAGLLLAGDPLARCYAAGEDARFSAEIWRRLENAAPAAPVRCGPAETAATHPSAVR